MTYIYYRQFLTKLQETIQPATFSYVFLCSAQKGSRAWTWLTVDEPNADDYCTVMEEGGKISASLVDDGCVKIVGLDGGINWAALEKELARYGEALEKFDTDNIPDILDIMRRWCSKHREPGYRRPRTSDKLSCEKIRI